MDLILDKIAERQAEMSQLPETVRNWVMFMRVWFFSGLIFVIWWKPARWIVLTMVATAAAIILSKIMFPLFNTFHAGTLIQLALWIPLAMYLSRSIKDTIIPALANPNFVHRLFGAWLTISVALVVISILLNFYNVATWLI